MALESARCSPSVTFLAIRSRLRISIAGVDTATELSQALEQTGCAEIWGASFAIDVR